MFEVGIVGQFEAAHSLRGNFGPATRRHGHTYRVEVAVRGADLKEDGTLFDIGLLQSTLHDVLAGLHYRDLDDLDVFQGQNTTAEAVAQYLFRRIAPRLLVAGNSDPEVGEADAHRSPVRSLAVRVWESPAAWASYEDEIQ